MNHLNPNWTDPLLLKSGYNISSLLQLIRESTFHHEVNEDARDNVRCKNEDEKKRNLRVISVGKIQKMLCIMKSTIISLRNYKKKIDIQMHGLPFWLLVHQQSFILHHYILLVLKLKITLLLLVIMEKEPL